MTSRPSLAIRFPLHLLSFLIILAIAVVSAVPAPARAAEPKADLLGAEDLIGNLQQGGYVIYLRHAATDRTQKKAQNMDLTDCKTQRNLSDKGRQQARVIGAAVKKLGIPVADVISSPFCRCLDTAKLAFGHATATDDLVFAIGLERAVADKKTTALRRMLATKPKAKTNTVIVAHTANLKEAAKVWPKPEGVAHVFEPQGDGKFRHLGRILPDEWEKLTAAR